MGDDTEGKSGQMELVHNGIAIVYGKETPNRKHKPAGLRVSVRLFASET